MSIFGKQKQGNGNRRQPTEVVRLTEDVLAHLWIKDGRVNWKLLRVNPEDDSRPFTTFRPRHLPQLVQAQAILASVFSEAPDLPDDERPAMKELSKLLESVAEMAKVDAPQKANGKDHSVLTFPQR